MVSQYYRERGDLVTYLPPPEGPARDAWRGLSRRGLIGGAPASAAPAASLALYRDARAAARNPSPQAAGD